jgi:transposase
MCAALDAHDPEWRQKSVVVLDNCPSHTSRNVKKVIKHLSIPALFTAPASFVCLPVEGFFAAIKGKEHNLEKISKDLQDELRLARPPSVKNTLCYSVG